jgi:hypothetical protein
MAWFANKGQVLQLTVQIGTAVGWSTMLAAVIGFVQKLQSGALDWWVLVTLFVVSLVIFVYADKKSRGREVVAVMPVAAAKESQRAIPVIGLVPEKVWIEPSSSPNVSFKLKLRIIWGNEGDNIHLGRPRWKPDGITIQGVDLTYSFQREEGGKEVADIDLPSGRRCRLWLGLDPAVSPEKAEQLRKELRLGVLTLPVMVGGAEMELKTRF